MPLSRGKEFYEKIKTAGFFIYNLSKKKLSYKGFDESV